MNRLLKIADIRGVLSRLEETIIFALIERAQFKLNPIIYKLGAFGSVLDPQESLVGYLLHETERIHARMRRYTNPEEEPFYTDLPAPILPGRKSPPCPIQPNNINMNPELRRAYEKETIPTLCQAGDDGQYGSSSVCDVTCLQAISTRVHYAKFVAESKYQSDKQAFDSPIGAGDRDALLQLITDAKIEAAVVDRVHRKATAYGQEPLPATTHDRINARIVTDLYSEWIIPLTKEVELRYLLERNIRIWK